MPWPMWRKNVIEGSGNGADNSPRVHVNCGKPRENKPYFFIDARNRSKASKKIEDEYPDWHAIPLDEVKAQARRNSARQADCPDLQYRTSRGRCPSFCRPITAIKNTRQLNGRNANGNPEWAQARSRNNQDHFQIIASRTSVGKFFRIFPFVCVFACQEFF